MEFLPVHLDNLWIVDILMGTFTKSFSGMGGYIAGSKELINFIKVNSAGILYHNSMSPIICQQVLTAFRVIMGTDGTDIGEKKLTALRENSNFFRTELKRLGLEVLEGRLDLVHLERARVVAVELAVEVALEANAPPA